MKNLRHWPLIYDAPLTQQNIAKINEALSASGAHTTPAGVAPGVGAHVEKRGWLKKFGAVMAGFGTLLTGYIAVLTGKNYEHAAEDRHKQEAGEVDDA